MRREGRAYSAPPLLKDKFIEGFVGGKRHSSLEG
jgi:hypothetical protein